MSAVNGHWSRALVTGASAGIGRAFATELASHGVDLVLVTRDTDRLANLARQVAAEHNVAALILKADLTDARALATVARRLADTPPIDLLVNNAGIGTFGDFAQSDLARERRILDVNVVALAELTHAALGAMTTRGSGTIINVSSLDGLQLTPHHATYGASKAFVNNFSASLHHESRGSGVTITNVMPGYVRTEFMRTAGIDGALDGVPSWMVLTPEQVAHQALNGAAAGRAVVVPGRAYRASAGVLSMLPSRVGLRIFSRLAPGQ